MPMAALKATLPAGALSPPVSLVPSTYSLPSCFDRQRVSEASCQI